MLELGLSEQLEHRSDVVGDPPVRALGHAIRRRRVVQLDARSGAPVVVHPVRLLRSRDVWVVGDDRRP